MAINCSPLAEYGIGPILVSLGPIDIRWYALAYIFGLILGWRYLVALTRKPQLWSAGTSATAPMQEKDVDDLLFWATIGVILGGRLGYVLFYMHETNPGWWQENPLMAFKLWEGGMSFHGGLLGVTAAMAWHAWSRKIPFLSVADGVAAVTPIGLFFGRIANFINGELYGRATDVAWAMRFPCDTEAAAAGAEPYLRHPSQLYEAVLEGLVLFIILRLATHRFNALRRPGVVTGLFLIGYGAFRTFVEFFREPDEGLKDLPFDVTMGMILSVPMVAVGAILLALALRSGKPQQA